LGVALEPLDDANISRGCFLRLTRHAGQVRVRARLGAKASDEVRIDIQNKEVLQTRKGSVSVRNCRKQKGSPHEVVRHEGGGKDPSLQSQNFEHGCQDGTSCSTLATQRAFLVKFPRVAIRHFAWKLSAFHACSSIYNNCASTICGVLFSCKMVELKQIIVRPSKIVSSCAHKCKGLNDCKGTSGRRTFVC